MYAGAPYGSFTFAGTGDDTKLWPVAKAQTQAQGKATTWLTFWEIAKATSQADVKQVTWNVVWLIAKSQTQAQVKPITLEASGSVDWNIAKTINQTDVKPFRWLTYWEVSKATNQAVVKPINWLTFWLIAKAETQDHVKAVEQWIASGSVDWSIAKSVTHTIVKDLDLDYVPITAIPDLTIVRAANGQSVDVDLLNSANANLSIERADDYIGAFSEIVNVELSELPHTDSGLDAEGSYMYRAAFTISGVKGGQPVEVAGEPGSIRVTIGKNKTL